MALILIVPFLGTVLGSALVFFLKEKIPPKVEKSLLGFASGVMIAASVWSLLIPSIEICGSMGGFLGKFQWFAAALGFLLGVFFLLLIDSLMPHLHIHSDRPEGVRSGFSKTALMVFAITLHNIPEGMSVGVTYAGVVAEGSAMKFTSALALSIGIALQNFPEGSIVSLPLLAEGKSKKKAFFLGALTGIVEPLFGFLTIIFSSVMIKFLPYLLSFAAGAMIYIVVEELIPESQEGEHSNTGTIGMALGFALMMILDVALG
ncbi:MAG: ZIP family metal transporter [Spirochaetales bacterium]|nr:ZIP family metal transporter [Spirochaetia bacterium]MDD7014772.1 ZIP family metal transporter [Spirochaetales bacterium]